MTSNIAKDNRERCLNAKADLAREQAEFDRRSKEARDRMAKETGAQNDRLKETRERLRREMTSLVSVQEGLSKNQVDQVNRQVEARQRAEKHLEDFQTTPTDYDRKLAALEDTFKRHTDDQSATNKFKALRDMLENYEKLQRKYSRNPIKLAEEIKVFQRNFSLQQITVKNAILDDHFEPSGFKLWANGAIAHIQMLNFLVEQGETIQSIKASKAMYEEDFHQLCLAYQNPKKLPKGGHKQLDKETLSKSEFSEVKSLMKKLSVHGSPLRAVSASDKILHCKEQPASSSRLDTVLGIDLGTSNSCVAIFENGKVNVIPNQMGLKITPSCVGYSDNQVAVGEDAKDQVLVNPKKTVLDIKRFVSACFENVDFQKYISLLPFDVISNRGIHILIDEDGKKEVTPSEVLLILLRKLKLDAESYIGGEVTGAVITVPSFFNVFQRQTIKEIAKRSGLNSVSVINDTIATAIALNYEDTIKSKQNFLVFDLGGGTLEVGIFSIIGAEVKTISVASDAQVGGTDFDSKLMEHLLVKIKHDHGHDKVINKKVLGRLRIHCEKAKIKLSIATRTLIDIPGLMGEDFEVWITRVIFEEICSEIFEKIINCVEKVIHDSRLNKREVGDVVLVGGSTRIPKIQQMLKDFFGINELNRTMNPDEVLAYGAALKASTD